MPRVLIIGLDGATWTVLAPLAESGRMPRLRDLMRAGTWGPLRSTIPALTMPSWSSFVTGRNPGGHGVFAFTRTDPHGYVPGGIANASTLRSPTLWDHLGRGGVTVGAVNVPPSYPLRPVNGYVVGCLLTPPGEPLGDPPSLGPLLADYVVDLKAPRQLRADMTTFTERSTAYLAALVDMTRRRTDVTLRLAAAHPTDVLCVVFYSPDRVQHNFWNEVMGYDLGNARVTDAIAQVYRGLDEAIGRLVDHAGSDATVILASDHGFVPRPARSVRVNRWLADEELVAEHAHWRLRRSVVRRLPERLRRRYDTLDHLQVRRAATRAWAETLDYATAGIWVHVRGRYPLGTVEPGPDYEAVRAHIVRGLSALRAPDGGRVFRQVVPREELYSGPYVDEAPDVVGVCAPGFGVVNQSLRRDLRSRELFGPFDEAGFTGTHDPAGIYLFAGANVQARGAQPELPIQAIAPTVLYLLGLPVPRSMDGPVALEMLDPALVGGRPVAFVDDADEGRAGGPGWASADDEARVAEHLRSLGYME